MFFHYYFANVRVFFIPTRNSTIFFYKTQIKPLIMNNKNTSYLLLHNLLAYSNLGDNLEKAWSNLLSILFI